MSSFEVRQRRRWPDREDGEFRRSREWTDAPPKTRGGYDISVALRSMHEAIEAHNESDAAWWAIELASSGFDRHVWTRIQAVVLSHTSLDDLDLVHDIQTLLRAYYAGYPTPNRYALITAVHLVATMEHSGEISKIANEVIKRRRDGPAPTPAKLPEEAVHEWTGHETTQSEESERV